MAVVLRGVRRAEACVLESLQSVYSYERGIGLNDHGSSCTIVPSDGDGGEEDGCLGLQPNAAEVFIHHLCAIAQIAVEGSPALRHLTRRQLTPCRCCRVLRSPAAHVVVGAGVRRPSGGPMAGAARRWPRNWPSALGERLCLLMTSAGRLGPGAEPRGEAMFAQDRGSSEAIGTRAYQWGGPQAAATCAANESARRRRHESGQSVFLRFCPRQP